VSDNLKIPYRIVKLGNGVSSIHSLEHDETFHPVVGPVAEAEGLYVKQLRLPQRMRQCAGEFVIWDVGLGAAANVLTVLRAAREIEGKLRVVSFDHTLAPLEFGLRHANELGYFDGFENTLRRLLSDHQVEFANGAQKVRWELRVADFPQFAASAAAEELPKPHAILFDAFSPATNPAMWTQPLFARIYQLLDPNRPCALPTYSRSTMLRVSLLLAGFYAGVGHATGEKEETTIAANSMSLIDEPLDRKWLARAHRSTSAEPLWTAEYRQAPMSAKTWAALQAHPQFSESHPTPRA
jgi:tRNA U34 5-methylaminomethyl-2-thiouridine-forming methyltransferase MnmC